MAASPADLGMLARVGKNAKVLAAIREGAVPSRDGRGPWSPDGWVMRTHPDLGEAMANAAPGTGLRAAIVYGVNTLVDARGRIIAVAWGTGRVWFVIDDGPAYSSAVEAGASAVDGLAGWVSVDAWKVDLHAWADASAILASGGRRA